MARQQAPGDFQVDIPEIGLFTFGKCRPNDVFRIRGDYMRNGGGLDENGNVSDMLALAYCTIKVLCVDAPAGFFDSLDPLVDDNWETKVFDVFGGLREKEITFRPGRGEVSETVGA